MNVPWGLENFFSYCLIRLIGEFNLVSGQLLNGEL